MKLAYVSPSLFPSRSANSIHVLHQCEALAATGIEVTVFAKRLTAARDGLPAQIRDAYGVDPDAINIRTIYTPFQRGNNLVIALFACINVLASDRYNAVLSRNPFASLVFSRLSRKQLIIEVHQVETGLRGHVQRLACRGKNAQIVSISEQLKLDLVGTVGKTARPVEIMHDAAPDRLNRPSEAEKRLWREELLPEAEDRDRFVCGYVGHLYPGRGIEIIEAAASKRPETLFLVIGGNDADIARMRAATTLPNLRFLGHMPHPAAQRAMSAVDILLMPYQKKVAIGVSGHDTGRWMSPMKMFEYMSSGTAFIASDLPILREVLQDNGNALLVQPDNSKAWESAIARLEQSPALRENIARQAYADYRADYTWTRRAERIAALLEP